MTRSDSLASLQQLALLAVVQLGDEAYGARIQDLLEQVRAQPVTIGTVYVTLDRLEKKGLASSHLAAPTPIRGGKAKRFYRVTDLGVRALTTAREELAQMWAGVEQHPAFRSGMS